MPLATNPSTGEVVYLNNEGAWTPAQTAVNPETKEMLAYDGTQWAAVPASKGIINYIDDAVRSIASGATFGWADEFAAKMDELTGRGGTYDQNIKKERAKDAQIPITIQLPGEIAGAVGTTVLTAPLAAFKAMASVSASLPQWMRFAAIGAGEGALAGAGNATEGNRAAGAATGAAIGAPIGAVAPSVVRGVQSMAGGIRNAVRPESGAAADIGRAMVRDGVNSSDLAAGMAAANADRAGVATLSDVGGENIRGLTERIANTPGAGRSQVIPALTERQTSQLSRLSDDLASLTGTRQTAMQAAEDVVRERAARAAPLYQAAYDAGDVAVWSPGLERLSSSPTVKNAMQGAVRVWQDNAIADGFGAMNPGAMVDRGGRLSFLNGQVPVFPNIQFWDYTKRIIDDQVGAALRAGENQKARTLTRLSQTLRSELDTAVPQYRAAREAWAGPSSYLNAIEEGRGVLNKSVSAEEFGATFRRLSASEQEAYRIGAVSSIVSKMGNDPAKLADLTKYLRAPEVRAKISAMMPTPEAAQAWQRRLDFEVRSSEMTGRALGNSATARRLAEADNAKGIVSDLVFDALTQGPASIGMLRRVLTAGPTWLRDTLRSRTDRQLADILTNPNRAQDLPAILQSATQKQQTSANIGSLGSSALRRSGINLSQ